MQSLRVLTFNVSGENCSALAPRGFGLPAKYAAIAQLILEERPELLTLQEVFPNAVSPEAACTPGLRAAGRAYSRGGAGQAARGQQQCLAPAEPCRQRGNSVLPLSPPNTPPVGNGGLPALYPYALARATRPPRTSGSLPQAAPLAEALLLAGYEPCGSVKSHCGYTQLWAEARLQARQYSEAGPVAIARIPLPLAAQGGGAAGPAGDAEPGPLRYLYFAGLWAPLLACCYPPRCVLHGTPSEPPCLQAACCCQHLHCPPFGHPPPSCQCCPCRQPAVLAPAGVLSCRGTVL